MSKKPIIISTFIVGVMFTLLFLIGNFIFAKFNEQEVLLRRLQGNSVSKRDFNRLEKKLTDKNKQIIEDIVGNSNFIVKEFELVTKEIDSLKKSKKSLELITHKIVGKNNFLVDVNNNKIIKKVDVLRNRFDALKKVVRTLGVIVKSNESFYSNSTGFIKSPQEEISVAGVGAGDAIVLEDVRTAPPKKEVLEPVKKEVKSIIVTPKNSVTTPKKNGKKKPSIRDEELLGIDFDDLF